MVGLKEDRLTATGSSSLECSVTMDKDSDDGLEWPQWGARR